MPMHVTAWCRRIVRRVIPAHEADLATSRSAGGAMHGVRL
jgi:hypothetical protein